MVEMLFRDEPFEIFVWKVLDGDSLRARRADDEGWRVSGNYISRWVDVRLAGLDAPESCQPGGCQATEYLRELAEGQCFMFGQTGRYGGRVYGVPYQPSSYDHDVENLLGTRILRAGWAWYYDEFISVPEFEEAERAARSEELGIWGPGMPTPIPPWEWRRGRRG